MTDRLQRWGERVLGRVQSVSPRIASRFEVEAAASAAEDAAGFQEIDVETPAARQAPLAPSPKPPPAFVPPSPEPESLETKTTPLRPAPKTEPRRKAIEPAPPSPPETQELTPPRQMKSDLVRESAEQPEPSEAQKEQPILPASRDARPAREVPETSVLQLKRLQEWIAAPPREQLPASEAPLPPASTIMPARAAEPKERSASVRPPSPSSRARVEPAPAPPAPVVVSIGTIIVRTNPAAAPRRPTPPPAATLATFLARRTAGQP